MRQNTAETILPSTNRILLKVN